MWMKMTTAKYLVIPNHTYKNGKGVIYRKRGLVTKDELNLRELTEDDVNIMDFENFNLIIPLELIEQVLAENK